MATPRRHALDHLLQRLSSADARDLKLIAAQVAAYVRRRSRASRDVLDEAEREAPRYQRRIDALRRAHDDLEDDLDRLTTGEVEPSVLAAHLRWLEQTDASLLSDVRYDDLGVGD